MTTSIQRILIFHQNLPEACKQPPLGEGASVDELQESILYYHRYATDSIHDETSRKDHAEEVVQFLGLCSALYQLPSNFVPSASNSSLSEQERTKYIRFESSTLVFIPLEGGGSTSSGDSNILAVVQVTRGGGNPLAIRQSIEDHHELFCLLRGGGITKRLAVCLSSMGELYQLLKRIRKTRGRIDRGISPGTKSQNADSRSTTTTTTAVEEDIEQLQRQVKILRTRSPISTLRTDLDAHYQDYLDHHSLVQSRNGGAGRCIVETIPKPITSLSAMIDNTTQKVPSMLPLSQSILKTLDGETRNLLDDHVTDRLLGIATFCDGELLHTHWSISVLTPLLNMKDEEGWTTSTSQINDVKVPDSQLRQLLRYFASYREKMALLPTPTAMSSNIIPVSTSVLGIQNILPSYSDHQHELSMTTLRMPETGQYLPPPPPFMLNATNGEPAYFEMSFQEKAWTIPVHLSMKIRTVVPRGSVAEATTYERLLAAHSVLYDFEDFSFLLFLGRDVQAENADTLLFSTLQLRLNELVSRSGFGNEFIRTRSPIDWNEPGQDILVVNRLRSQVRWVSQRPAGRHVPHSNPVHDINSGRPRSFFGLPIPLVKKRAPSKPSEVRLSYDILEWAALGLDSRHLLASHLHLDTLLALDDMMNELEWRRRREQTRIHLAENDESRRRSTSSSGCVTTLELCTCMPTGWVYACSTMNGGSEVYAFFDSNVYVTVADVQCAITKVKEQLLLGYQ